MRDGSVSEGSPMEIVNAVGIANVSNENDGCVCILCVKCVVLVWQASRQGR